MHIIDTSITIAAEPKAVWDIVVDFAGYREWNPFIIEAAGEPVAGAVLEVRVQPPGEQARTHRPTVLDAEPGRSLRWLGTVVRPWLFSGRHEFHLEATGAGTVFHHREEFRGLLVPFLRRTLRRTEEGFSAMNRALKQRAESSG